MEEGKAHEYYKAMQAAGAGAATAKQGLGYSGPPRCAQWAGSRQCAAPACFRTEACPCLAAARSAVLPVHCPPVHRRGPPPQQAPAGPPGGPPFMPPPGAGPPPGMPPPYGGRPPFPGPPFMGVPGFRPPGPPMGGPGYGRPPFMPPGGPGMMAPTFRPPPRVDQERQRRVAEAWSAHKAEDGSTYFHNAVSAGVWQRPLHARSAVHRRPAEHAHQAPSRHPPPPTSHPPARARPRPASPGERRVQLGAAPGVHRGRAARQQQPGAREDRKGGGQRLAGGDV